MLAATATSRLQDQRIGPDRLAREAHGVQTGPWIYKKPDGTASVRVHRFEVTDGDVDKCYLPQPGRSDWRMGGEGGRPTAVQDARRPALPPRRRQGDRRDAASLHRRGREAPRRLAELFGKNDSVAITTCIDGARGWTPDINQYFKDKDCVWCRTTTSPDTIGSTR